METSEFIGGRPRGATRRFSRRQALRAGGAGLAAAGVAAAGLGRTAVAQEGTPAAAATPGAGVGHLPAALAELDTLTPKMMTLTGVPGVAIAVVSQDRVVYSKGFGVREVGKGAAVDADTVFPLASLSKPLASTVVAGVVGDGTVSWDSRMADVDPSFQLHEPFPTSQVTLTDLFSHRSGLPDHAGDLLEDLGFDRATILHRLRYLTPEYSFRASYAYTNFGLTAAAVAAADAAGMSWEDLSAAKLYKPLGMTRTSSRHADYLATANRALGHIEVEGKWVLPKVARDPDPESPAGGVSSCVHDLAQWMRLQLNDGKVGGKQIIGAAALADTHRAHSIRTPPAANPATDATPLYGLGWNVGQDREGRITWSHSGAFNLGAGTTVYLLPQEGLGIVVLTNGQPIGMAEAIALSFLEVAHTGALTHDYFTLLQPAFAALIAPTYGTSVDYAKPPANPVPAQADAVYAGTYRNDFFGTAEVATANGGLVLKLGPTLTPFPLRHWDGDVFLYQPEGENAYGPSAVTFTVGADGKADRVLIENLNIHGAGTLERVAAGA